MAAAIVFDVNDTLLDTSALDPLFADAFGDKGTRKVWFAQTLQSAMAMTITGEYAPFGELARAALDMTARKRGVALDAERAKRIMRGFAALPAHGDAAAGLTQLRAAGYQLAVLAQATASMLEEQLAHAKLRGFFDYVLSTESVGKFKPAAETYAYAAAQLGGAAPLLVTAHDWDAAGASHAGWQTAFVARFGTALNPAFARPTIVAPDLRAVASAICAQVPLVAA